MREEILAGNVGHKPLHLADAEIDRRLAEINRHELGVQIRDMDQRDIAERFEPQEISLCQTLLRGGLTKRPDATAGGDRRRCEACLHEFAPGDHVPSQSHDSSVAVPKPLATTIFRTSGGISERRAASGAAPVLAGLLCPGADSRDQARLQACVQATVSLFFETYSEPSSSFQVKVNSPDLAAL